MSKESISQNWSLTTLSSIMLVLSYFFAQTDIFSNVSLPLNRHYYNTCDNKLI
ncbi:MAG: hypothetical protein K0B02_01125 [DPANN group archaeon]|nr:hypothetical protein [DPANN group archaeon]